VQDLDFFGSNTNSSLHKYDNEVLFNIRCVFSCKISMSLAPSRTCTGSRGVLATVQILKRTLYYFCTVNALGHLFLRVRGCRLCLDKCLTTVFTVCLKLNPHALPKLNPHALPDTKPGQATSSRQVPYHCHRSAALLVATTAPRAATMLASAPSRPSATSGTRRPCPGETM
jgi:hypothetical protein